MGVLSLRTNFAGENYQSARLVRLSSNDPIATVTAAGYLNTYMIMNAIGLYTTDFVHVAASDATQIYKPAFTNGTPQQGGSVQLVALS
jgi:hypothetical protein